MYTIRRIKLSVVRYFKMSSNNFSSKETNDLVNIYVMKLIELHARSMKLEDTKHNRHLNIRPIEGCCIGSLVPTPLRHKTLVRKAADDVNVKFFSTKEFSHVLISLLNIFETPGTFS